MDSLNGMVFLHHLMDEGKGSFEVEGVTVGIDPRASVCLQASGQLMSSVEVALVS